MKTNVSLFSVLFLMSFFLGQAVYAQKEVQIKTSATCDMCKTKIEKALKSEEGVKSANLDLTTKIVTVKFDEKVTDEFKIKNCISKVGYDADDVLADKDAAAKLPGCCKKKKSCDTH